MTDSLRESYEQSKLSSTALTTSCANVSRRRLAFRPQSVKTSGKPIRFSCDTSQPSTSSSVISDQSKIDAGNATSSKILNVNEADSESAILQSNQQPQSSQNQQNVQKTRRRLVTNWSFQETLVFYDSLKQNGKDFEAIARHMTRKKLSKDRDQIRNYYFNAFKIWKTKAQIEESDWTGIPRDARELFVVLNGCEWRKKTGGANFEPLKFKTLILEGSTSVRIKKKKSLVTIRTPYCPCLLKFFPYDKRNAEIPTHLSLKLIPFRYTDRNFVVTSEQNPLLHVRININDKIGNVFELLEKKWTLPEKKLANFVGIESSTMPTYLLLLRVTENVQIHKVQVNLDAENFPLMSLRKLKRDFGDDLKIGDKKTELIEAQISEQPSTQFSSTSFSAEENSNEAQKIYSSAKTSKASKDSNIIKLGFSSIKEVFDLDETKLKKGMTKENVGNASVLQLFYLCGMTSEITLTYEVCKPPIDLELSWKYFVSLVSRDYGELMAKSFQQHQTTSANRVEEIDENNASMDSNSNTAIFLGAQYATNSNNVSSHAGTNNLNDLKKRKRGKSSSTCLATTSTNLLSTTNPAAEPCSNSTAGHKDHAGNHVSSIVEMENEQFLKQLREMQQQTSKRPKRQVKVLPNPKRGPKFFANAQRSQPNPQIIHQPQSNLNNNFCKVVNSNNFIPAEQPYTYLITSAPSDHDYEPNIGNIVDANQSIAVDHSLVQHQPVPLQTQQQPSQHSSIIYPGQELVNDSQRVFAVLRNDGNAVSVVPVVTTVGLDNQYSYLTECSVETIPAIASQSSNLTAGIMVNELANAKKKNATIYLAHNPPPPTDFSHFATTSTTTNLELQTFVPILERVHLQPSPNCLQPLSSSTISASFRSPTKFRYSRQYRSIEQQPQSARNQNNSQNDIIILADPELTNTSVGDFSADSFSLSTFIGCSSGNGTSNSGAGNPQVSANSSSILLLENSPSKTLPEDVRNAYEQMLKENSVDYCRNFEQLTRNMDLIHKNVSGHSHEEVMNISVNSSGTEGNLRTSLNSSSLGTTDRNGKKKGNSNSVTEKQVN